jgi:uncharacterized protein
MPRQRRLRKVVAPPNFKGYKPYGVNNNTEEFIELLYEEYEAIKLADYDIMNHKEAAELMGVSRPTFARIYESARRKIADAFVGTKEIRAVYGNALLDKNWYICNDCHSRFTIPKIIMKNKCPLCSSQEIELLNSQIPKI